DPLPELGEKPCLSDARLAGHGHELNGGVTQRSRVDGLEEREIVVAADQRRADDRLHVDAETTARSDCMPERQRLRFALQRHRLERLVLDKLLRRAVGGLADDDVAYWR